MMQMPKPRDLPVIEETEHFIVVDDGVNHRIGLRKPLRDGRWKQNRNTEGRLISLSLIIAGVN